MGECPDVVCRTDSEHRLTFLEGSTKTLSEEMSEVKAAVKKTAENMLQIKWFVAGACGLYFTKELGILAIVKALLF